MDIFNRPPAVAEDTLQYTIFPPPGLSDKTSVTTFAACIREFTDSLLSDFIWHRDAFEVKVVPNPDGDGWILEGRMRVGDCVDDEWFAVWLLKEVSSKWDVVISIFDSDGEFLLIEAAEALPSWVKPTNSENRVWIHKSRLHLIPLSHVSPPSRKQQRRKLPGSTDSGDEGADDEVDEDWISAEDGVSVVRSPSADTLAPPKVENIIWERISGYPAATRSHVHITKAYIPTDIARALVANPHLVQKAVETFYTRDAIQLRAAHRMSRFPPDTSVLMPVKMTRTAYAQLVGQKFFPPKVFGRWQGKEGTAEWRWRDVGMKIAVGFEMLYQESKGRPSTANTSIEGIQSSAEANKEALRRNPDYQKYIQNLVSADYFKGEIEGSELWNKLENKAASTFVEVRRTDDASRKSFASQVDTALAEVKLLPDLGNQDEDNDDWLNVNADDFEQMLERTMGPSKGATQREADAMDVDKPESEMHPEDRLAAEQAERLKDLAAKVENFVEGEGDIEGARFEDEEFSDEPFSDDESSNSDDEDAQTKSAKRQAAMDKLVPGLNSSEYGQMPASFHANSQRVAPTTLESDIVEEPSNEKIKLASDAKLQAKPIRQPILPRDKYDGVDSDDETDEEEEGDEDDESEEDRPQVVGEIDIDMGEEEEEFLEFSRQALGISDAQWNEIISDRKNRGAFLPASAKAKTQTTTSPAPTRPVGSTDKPEGRTPAPGPRPNVNPNLDSFEAIMTAMDEELSRIRPSKGAAAAKGASLPSASKDKGKGKARSEPEEDIEAAMDAELKASLEHGGGIDEDGSDEEPMDYNMIKNFLESFKSQAGLSGPVSNLAGRLQPGWNLPRDEVP